MAYCVRLIVMLFSVLACFSSFALIPPQSDQAWYNNWYKVNMPSYQVCITDFPGRNSIYHSTRIISTSFVDGKTVVNVQVTELKTGKDLPYSYSCIQSGPYTCPANSYLTDGGCACNSGYSEVGNSCEVVIPDACENIASTCSGFKNERMPRFEVYYSGSSPSGACSGAPISGCSKGCYLEFTGVSVYYKDQDGKSVASGSAVFTGDSCDHSEEASEPDPEKACKAGEFPGTVNGTKVCLPAKSKETEHQPKKENNADGSSSETTSTVSCADGKCTVTETTTTKDSEGNVTGVSSGSTSYGESDFCQKNPASGVCSGNGSGDEEGEGKGSFGGSCSSGFTCEGDAATCAIAQEQHRVNCELSDSNNPLSRLFEDSQGTGFGVEELDFDLSNQLNFDSIIGSGSCPADVEVIVFGQPITIKLSDYCPYFAILGNLLVLGATVVCFRILGSA